MSMFEGVNYHSIYKRIQRKIFQLLIKRGENPKNYQFADGFVITPLLQTIGNQTFANQIISIGLVNTLTHEIKYYAIHKILEEILEERSLLTENTEACSVTNLWDYKHKKEDIDSVPHGTAEE